MKRKTLEKQMKIEALGNCHAHGNHRVCAALRAPTSLQTSSVFPPTAVLCMCLASAAALQLWIRRACQFRLWYSIQQTCSCSCACCCFGVLLRCDAVFELAVGV